MNNAPLFILINRQEKDILGFSH